jgi:hypothetical protein
MNDFCELENELRKLRPAQPSPVLFERVDGALENRGAHVNERRTPKRRWSGFEPGHSWLSLGFGLAAAAVLVLFAAVTMEHRREQQKTVARISPVIREQPASRGTTQLVSPAKFVSAGGSDLVYNARDEGLHFTRSSDRPVRRLRYQTEQTWRWRNPETGASLRVSYPSEEIVLIPVSGQ